MQTTTVLLSILTIFVAFALAWYHYLYKKKGARLLWLLTALRFGFLTCLGLLLIGPEFDQNTNYIEKSNLIIAVDNSSSITTVGGTKEARTVLSQLQINTALKDKFSVHTYSFDNALETLDSLDFSAKKTDLAAVLESLNEIYRDTNSAVVLVTDGNQTLGQDYEYTALDKQLAVYPVVVGDTTVYEDIRVAQANANKYAFLENQFPLEVTLAYTGVASVESVLRVTMEGQQVFREAFTLSGRDNSRRFSPLLKAKSVGLKNIGITVTPISGERNTINNSRTIAVEVIDEKTKVSIVSTMAHPDIGMLKKAIEANEQRSVTIIKPNAATTVLQETDVFVLYQPNGSFKNVYDFIKNKGASNFTVTGQHTDWNFLNEEQTSIVKEDLGQSEELFGTKNAAFAYFDTGSFTVEGYPPLLGGLGNIMITKPHEVLLNQKIKGVVLDNPLLAVVEDSGVKSAYLFGENSWKWRVETYRNEKSFKSFDDGIDKLLRYLADAAPKSRLDISYESVYEGTGNAVINAAYFDKAYVFDPNAKLTLNLRNKTTDFKRELPLLLSNTSYRADLSALQAGEYAFTVAVEGGNISKSGSFKILDFDLEKQLLSADHLKLERFASAKNGTLFYPSQREKLLQTLLEDRRFIPVQKSIQNVVSLIDFRWLLGLTVLFAAAEWFIRKYNGLI